MGSWHVEHSLLRSKRATISGGISRTQLSATAAFRPEGLAAAAAAADAQGPAAAAGGSVMDQSDEDCEDDESPCPPEVLGNN